ncbi:MAG: hypothetical protein P8106_00535 [Gammaproteobacteria bacterium]|jgi:hypothetical protein
MREPTTRKLPRLAALAVLLLAAPVGNAALIVCNVHGQYLAFFPGENIGSARTLARQQTSSCLEVVSCPTVGWFAAARSRDAAGRWGNRLGVACGHARQTNAENQAMRECAAQGGTGCAVWRAGEDDGAPAKFDAARAVYCAVRDTECATL